MPLTRGTAVRSTGLLTWVSHSGSPLALSLKILKGLMAHCVPQQLKWKLRSGHYILL